jgi:hypothetical protein
MTAVTSVWEFTVHLWNNVVALAPTIMHAVCQVVDQASKTVTF